MKISVPNPRTGTACIILIFGVPPQLTSSITRSGIRTPYLRCTIYDLVQVDPHQTTTAGRPKFQLSRPNRTFYIWAVLHNGLVLQDDVDHHMYKVLKEGHLHNCVECQEIRAVVDHTAWLLDTMDTLFEDRKYRDNKLLTATLQRHILCYPASGRAHAALTIEVSLGNEISEVEGELNELLNTIAWFEDPAEEGTSVVNDDRRTSHFNGHTDGSTRGRLHLPILIHHEYDTLLENVPRNEQRLCGVSAAKFLSVLGIKDIPVYCLATNDKYAYLSACWYSGEQSVCVR